MVRYNIIVDADDYGLSIQNSEDGVITNNTVYKNDLMSWGGNHFGNHEGRLTSFTGNVVKNNIFTGGNNSHGALYIENIPNIELTNDITNNLYKCRDGSNVVIVDTTMGPITYDSFDQLWLPFHRGSIAADPLFSNAAGGDYTLATGSPAINAGHHFADTVDILGNLVGSSPDMGACEHIFPDNDGDGHTSEFDCDDNNASINPGEAEICDDTIDNDCDNNADCDDRDCNNSPLCKTGGSPEICDDGIDNDGDNKVDCADKKDCAKDPSC